MPGFFQGSVIPVTQKFALQWLLCQAPCVIGSASGLVSLVSVYCDYLLTYAHRSQWSIGHQRPPAIALCSGLLLSFPTSCSPAVSTLASVSRLHLLRGWPLFLFPCGFQVRTWRVVAGCWLPEGVSDPAPLPPQYLFGHWFLSRSLPQIFISNLLLPLDFVDAPQTGVEECLDLSLHRLCCPPCLTSVKQD